MKPTRHTLAASVVAPLMMAGMLTGLVGCKTAPKLAWWKKDAPATAMAHSAPALPADIVKQAESMAAAEPSIQISPQTSPSLQASTPSIDLTEPSIQMAPPSTSVAGTVPAASGGRTAPYMPANVAANAAVPTAGSPGYPTTGASPYSSQPPAAMVAAATPRRDVSADLGSVDMPYNPNAVPPARTVAAAAAAAPSAASEPADRYAAATVTNPGSSYADRAQAATAQASTPLESTPAQVAQEMDRYANAAPAEAAMQAAAAGSAAIDSARSSAADSASNSVASSNGSDDRYANYDRYAQNTMPAVAVPDNSDALAAAEAAMASATKPSPPMSNPTTPNPTTSNPAATVASATPYRPGGTGTYPGGGFSTATAEIASRRGAPGASAPAPTTNADSQRYR